MTKNMYNLLDYQALFKTYLISQKYSTSTVKNYLSDLNNCFEWLIKTTKYEYSVLSPLIDLNSFLSSRALEQYLLDIKKSSNINTVNRRIISIRRFCDFAVNKEWLHENPIDLIVNSINQDSHETGVFINEFNAYLDKQGNSNKTRKHYSADISEFINIISSN